MINHTYSDEVVWGMLDSNCAIIVKFFGNESFTALCSLETERNVTKSHLGLRIRIQSVSVYLTTTAMARFTTAIEMV